MAEDAFERFRRLRGIAQSVTTPVQPQQTEGEAPVSPLALLLDLHERGVILTPYPDGTIRCRAPKGVLTPVLHDAIRQHKAALLDLVEEFEERAAIAEYCGGLPRDVAEDLAWHCLVEHETLEVSTP